MITVMMYTRAAASDYDDWANGYNNPGWGSKELIPLLQKVRADAPSSYDLLAHSVFRLRCLMEMLRSMVRMALSGSLTEKTDLVSQKTSST